MKKNWPVRRKDACWLKQMKNLRRFTVGIFISSRRIETFEEDEKVDKVEDAYMEYDLSDGRILAIRYYNRGDGDNLDLYVSRAYIREVYNPAEEEGSPGEAPVPSAFPSPSAAAA